jgi:hypothetical protein
VIDKFRRYMVKYRAHALERMIQRSITLKEINDIIENMEMIKEYPEDKPFPSYLALGFTKKKRPLHMVFSIAEIEKIIFIISVYEPDMSKWEPDLKRRKK